MMLFQSDDQNISRVKNVSYQETLELSGWKTPSVLLKLTHYLLGPDMEIVKFAKK